MDYDDFQLDEKYDERYNEYSLDFPRRDSEFMMREAIISKKDELKSYNKLLRLYGAESPNLQPNNPQLSQNIHQRQIPTSSIAVNKILETKHNLSVENQILNFFVFIASVFLLFQFSIIAIIKMDVDFPSLSFINYEVFFHYAYLTVLIVGKSLTYLFMFTFFTRIYIGFKVFKKSVTTNVLLKVMSKQFNGFLSSSSVTVGIIALDMLLKITLTKLEIIEEINDFYFNGVLKSFKSITSMLDIVFYSTIVLGLVLSLTRRIIRLFTSTNSVQLEDVEQ